MASEMDSASKRSLDGLAVLDAHCHVDLYPNPSAIIAEADRLGIRTIAVTNAPSVFSHTRDLAADSRYVRAAVGLHPELVHSHGHELDLLWPMLEQTRYVGEIGLDYVTADTLNRAQQRKVFAAIIEHCARLGGKILTIHSRRAAADVIATIGTQFRGAAILHWFSGTVREVDRAVQAGYYFSVNTPMLAGKKGQALIARMPTDRVLTESDGPFGRIDGRAATPSDTGEAVRGLAHLWGVEPQEAAQKVLANLRELLKQE